MPGEVVGGGPEATRGDDNLGPLAGLAEDQHVVGQCVANGSMKRHRHADLQQPLGQPLAIGVQPLSSRHFVADGDDFGSHKTVRCQWSVVRGILGAEASL
jgi:hypothetical protein